jgi:hypothetical protein
MPYVMAHFASVLTSVGKVNISKDVYVVLSSQVLRRHVDTCRQAGPGQARLASHVPYGAGGEPPRALSNTVSYLACFPRYLFSSCHCHYGTCRRHLGSYSLEELQVSNAVTSHEPSLGMHLPTYPLFPAVHTYLPRLTSNASDMPSRKPRASSGLASPIYHIHSTMNFILSLSGHHRVNPSIPLHFSGKVKDDGTQHTAPSTRRSAVL